MNGTEREKEKGQKYELNVRLPKSLAERRKELVPAFGYGCHLILVGERPAAIPDDKTVAVRIPMQEKDWAKWEETICKMPKIPKATLVTTIFALVDELGAYNARL